MGISKNDITAYRKFKKDLKKTEGKAPLVKLKNQKNEKIYTIIDNINKSSVIQKQQ